MSSASSSAETISDRIQALCSSFRLPTVAVEAVPRFADAGQGDALETLLEVLELEAGDRQQRRVDRLRRASKLPPGKTLDTFELDRFPAVRSWLERVRGQPLHVPMGDASEDGAP